MILCDSRCDSCHDSLIPAKIPVISKPIDVIRNRGGPLAIASLLIIACVWHEVDFKAWLNTTLIIIKSRDLANSYRYNWLKIRMQLGHEDNSDHHDRSIVKENKRAEWR